MNKVRVGSTWKSVSVPFARVNGGWRPCKQMWVKANGTWRIAFDLTEPDPFDGSGTLNETPGNVPWQQLSGTWTKGSGLVASNDTSNRVAAIDAGTSDITINIDADDANKSGEGIAFWIQDQLNWWGLKTYYNYYSYTVASNSYYNHFCNVVVENQTQTNNSGILSILTYYVRNYATTGYNYTTRNYLTRVCSCTNGTVTSPQQTITSQQACVSSCTGNQFAPCSKTSCGTQGKYNCGGACAAGSCPTGTSSSNTTPYNPCNFSGACPSNFGSSGNLISGARNCSWSSNTNYVCTNGTCTTCNYSFVFSPYTQRFFSVPTSNKNCANTGVVYTYSCTPESVQLPPNTVYVYETQLQLIRSQAGSVNVVNSQSYSNMGNVYAVTSGNQITARAYSAAGQSGTLYGPWNYDAGSVPKGNKHGILISSVPYQQTYSISRFEADL